MEFEYIALKSSFKSYWRWFYAVISLISLVDFVDHLTRADPYFRSHWFSWLLFTLASTVSVCIIIFLADYITKKRWGNENIILQSASILFGMLIHVYLTGPFFDKLIFGQPTLHFYPSPVLLLSGLGIFYLTRLVTYFLAKH